MPRTTRAAAKAQEAEIEIATDETQTEACTQSLDDNKEEARPALVELTANAVEEIELGMAIKDDGKATKNGRDASKKPATKKLKGAMKSRKAPKAMQKDNAHDEETGSSSEASIGKEDAEGPSERSQSLEGVTDVALQSETVTGAPPTETESAQKLELLFQEPFEQGSEQPVQEIMANVANIAEAAPVESAEKDQQTTAPATVKNKPTGLVKRKATPPMHAKTTHKKREVTPKVGVKSRISTVSRRPSISTQRRPSIAPKQTKASTLRARMSSGGPLKPVSPVKKAAEDKPVTDATPVVPVEKTSASPTKEIKVQKRRPTIAALNTPPRLVKSSKAPTTSTFKLPSEALQEKFKTQREERQRRQEEQAQKVKDGGARPTIPPKHTTKPRETPSAKTTKASSGRLSMGSTLKERPNGFRTTVEKKAMTMKSSHRPSLSVSSGNAVKAVRPTAHARSVSAASVCKPEPPQPTVLMTAAEKAEAAKKARAEAAERGRAASKAWAEKKQKDIETKKAATRVVSEESKENAPIAV